MTRKHRPGSRKKPPVLLFLTLIALSSLMLTLMARKPAGKALTIETGKGSDETEEAVPRESSKVLFPVHVDGAVMLPGIYYLPEGAILEEAVLLAGGFTEDADTASINLAMLCSPHMKIYIPKEGEAAPLWQEAGSPPQALVDINRAGRAELMTLSGVGEATADAIISFREEHGPFAKIEDIMRVPGIKEGRFAKLKDRITTGYP